VAQLGARLDGIEEVVGSNPIGSTNFLQSVTIPENFFLRTLAIEFCFRFFFTHHYRRTILSPRIPTL
jgi:hypothetical protein